MANLPRSIAVLAMTSHEQKARAATFPCGMAILAMILQGRDPD
jgi:hypothetical protein